MKINGITGYLWRAVEQHGNVLDVLVQSRRNAKAAKRFFGKLLKCLRYVPPAPLPTLRAADAAEEAE